MARKSLMAAVLAAGLVSTGIVIRSLLNDTLKYDEDDDDEINFINITEEEADDNEDEEELVKEEVSPEAQEIAGLYPYLKTDFIAEQFGRNEIFNREYPEDTLVTISHKAKFETEEMMQEFAKIAEENGYQANTIDATENLITKKMFTEDGSILSDIFNVANQVACLNGTYEGYRID